MKKTISIIVLLLTIGQIGFAQTNCNKTCNQNLIATTVSKFPSLSNTSGWHIVNNNQRVRITISYTITPISQKQLLCNCHYCSGNLIVNQRIRLQATIKCEAQMKSLIGSTWAQTSVFKPDFEIDFNSVFFNYNLNSLTDQGEIGNCTTNADDLEFSEIYHFPKTQNFDQLENDYWNAYPSNIYRRPNTNNSSTNFFDVEVIAVGNKWFSQPPTLTGSIACRVKKGSNWINMGNIIL